MNKGNGNKKRILSLLLVLTMVLSLFAGSAKEAKADSGVVADISSWIQVNGNYVTITPQGGQEYALSRYADMPEYHYDLVVNRRIGKLIQDVTSGSNLDSNLVLDNQDGYAFYQEETTMYLSENESIAIFIYDETNSYDERYYAITGAGFFACHTNHNWDYKRSSYSNDLYNIYAACNVSCCPYYEANFQDYPQYSAISCTFSVKNQGRVSEGTPYSGATIEKNNWDKAGLVEPKLQYSLNYPYNWTDTAPTELGEYVAQLDVNGVTTDSLVFEYTMPKIENVTINVAGNIPSVQEGTTVGENDYSGYFSVADDAEYEIGDVAFLKLKSDGSYNPYSNPLSNGHEFSTYDLYAYVMVIQSKNGNLSFADDVTVTGAGLKTYTDTYSESFIYVYYPLTIADREVETIDSVTINVASVIPSIVPGDMASEAAYWEFFTVPEDAKYMIDMGMVGKVESDGTIRMLDDGGYVIQDGENYVWIVGLFADRFCLFSEDVTVNGDENFTVMDNYSEFLTVCYPLETAEFQAPPVGPIENISAQVSLAESDNNYYVYKVSGIEKEPGYRWGFYLGQASEGQTVTEAIQARLDDYLRCDTDEYEHELAMIWGADYAPEPYYLEDEFYGRPIDDYDYIEIIKLNAKGHIQEVAVLPLHGEAEDDDEEPAETATVTFVKSNFEGILGYSDGTTEPIVLEGLEIEIQKGSTLIVVSDTNFTLKLADSTMSATPLGDAGLFMCEVGVIQDNVTITIAPAALEEPAGFTLTMTNKADYPEGAVYISKETGLTAGSLVSIYISAPEGYEFTSDMYEEIRNSIKLDGARLDYIDIDSSYVRIDLYGFTKDATIEIKAEPQEILEIYIDFNTYVTNVDKHGPNWTWDGETHTLTLNGVNIEAEDGYNAIQVPYGTTIVLADGTRNVISGYSHGFYIREGLSESLYVKITGTGTLEIENCSTGIYVSDGNLIFEQGTVIVDSDINVQKVAGGSNPQNSITFTPNAKVKVWGEIYNCPINADGCTITGAVFKDADGNEYTEYKDGIWKMVQAEEGKPILINFPEEEDPTPEEPTTTPEPEEPTTTPEPEEPTTTPEPEEPTTTPTPEDPTTTPKPEDPTTTPEPE
ncbi:MAG: hypothetical protein IKT67_06790, partial [Lachnospiraceae bacterium]|nr:hypothetical protein [Lachnospiraceae bacterium]